MRLLHTADWHVGKGLQGRSRLDEQAGVLIEIAGIARREEVDLICVAGDLFDSASPTPEAERVVYRALLELSDVAHVVVVPGNHDSERRLEAIASVFDLANVKIRAFVDREPLEISASDGSTAIVATLPWISQRYIVKAEHLMAADPFEHAAQFGERLSRIIGELCAPFRKDTVNLLVGHLTVAGGRLGGGERTAQTIFDYYIPATAFPSNAHYVALGHLHKMQTMAGPCPVHYCGSPIDLDFSDDETGRHVMLVDLQPGVPAEPRSVALTSGRKLRTLAGTRKQLEKLIGTTGDDFLRVIVKEKAHTGLGDEIREMFPEAVKIVVEGTGEERGESAGSDRKGLTPQELFELYLSTKEIDDPALVGLFTRLYEDCA